MKTRATMGLLMCERLAAVVCRGCLAAVLLAAVPAGAQTEVDIVDTWEAAGLGGWTNSASSQCALSNPGGYLNLRFAGQTQPDFAADTAQRNSTGIVVTNISFRFRAADTPPSAVRLYFHSPVSGHSWYVPLEAPAVGEWVEYSVPLNETTAWSMGPEGTLDQFNADIAWVDWVGVYVRRHGASSVQNYCVDDFRIQGFQLLDTDGDNMPDAWEVSNYLNPYDPADALADYDGDGVTNVQEYWASSDPWDVKDKFMAEIEPDDTAGGGVIVKWKSTRNRTYKLYRSGNLKQGFTLHATGIAGTPPYNYYRDTSVTNSGPYFYRISVE